MRDARPVAGARLAPVEVPLFEQVGEATRSLVPADVGPVRYRAHRGGVKVWIGGDKPGRHHFEAQLVARRHVDDGSGVVLEVGFHAEHGDVARNDAALAAIESASKRWRKELGEAPEAGPFLGRPDDWRRVSEVWFEPDLEDPDLVLEVAGRLADYVALLQPLLPDPDL